MSKQSRELKKQFTKLVDDIFDNYDKYTVEEKSRVKNCFCQLKDLNSLLEKYDKKTKNIWIEIMENFGNAAGLKK